MSMRADTNALAAAGGVQAPVPRLNCDLASAVAEAHAAYAACRPRSRALHDQARAVMPGGNTRSVLSYRPFPTAMARSEGCHLCDVDGHEYLDLCGEYTAGLFGHSEPRIQAAVVEAIGHGLNLSAVGEAEVELARILCRRFPSMQLVRFTNSGTEANLMALTAARAFTGRQAVLAFRGGYHGGVLTFPVEDASAATVPFPFVMADYNDAAGAQVLIHARAGDLAAVIVEPMLGSGGCIPAQARLPGGLARCYIGCRHAAGLRRGDDLPHEWGRAAGASRDRAGPDHIGQIRGGRHELRRVRRPG